MGNYPKSINASSLNDWFNSEKEDPVLIDVREQAELEIAAFSKEFCMAVRWPRRKEIYSINEKSHRYNRES